nr:UDP-glucose/GDP-mannose dehydrogenase family protein [Candidatus Njordarchaeota archaeon]
MTNSPVKITVIGLGYVGLTTALCFASRGLNVIGVDIDQNKVDAINSKNPPIHESGLDKILADSIEKGFRATTEIPRSDIYLVTVGTPSRNDGSIDLNYVEKASEEIGETIKEHGTDNYPLVAVKSTVLPGTTRNIVKPKLESTSGKKVGVDVGLCSNPEFLREGSAVEDTFNPDKIIIGEYDKRSGDILETLYHDFYQVNNMPPQIRTTIENAELMKYANNAFLAMKVSFINEIARLCEKIPGADVEDVAKGIGLDKRIGERFLNAGLGWGGSCFPKDVKALIAFSKSIGYKPLIVSSTLEVNEKQPLTSVEIARKALGRLKGRRIAILGLAFKPNTDDIREAVSLKIIGRLLDEGAKVEVYDPIATSNVEKILAEKITYSTSASDCLKEAECCIIVTEWDEFKKLTPDDFLRNMKNPVVIDGRRVFKPSEFTGKGVKYIAIGLGEEASKTSD